MTDLPPPADHEPRAPGVPMPSADGFRMLLAYMRDDFGELCTLANAMGGDVALGEVMAVSVRIGAMALGGTDPLAAFCVEALELLEPGGA